MRPGVTQLFCWLVTAGLSVPAAASVGGNCVTYAREVTGIQISGDAGAWWNNAAGRYGRGHAPEPGAVLVFKPHGAMWHGHVAVVSHLVNRREILVDQANWVPGRVVKNMAVYDVSAANDWSAVRVADYRSVSWGRINPTFGFIYPHASDATGGDTVVSAVYHPAGQAHHRPAVRVASDETVDDTEPAQERRSRHDRLGSRATLRRGRTAAEPREHKDRHHEDVALNRDDGKRHERHAERFAKAEPLPYREGLAAKKAKLTAHDERKARPPRREALASADRHPVAVGHHRDGAERHVAEVKHHTVAANRHIAKAQHHAVAEHHVKAEPARHAETRTARVEHPASRHRPHLASHATQQGMPEQIAEAPGRAN